MDIPYDPNIKFASFDITNMYSDVPTNELLKIINIMCEKHGMNNRLQQKIMKISQIVIEQNYFQFHIERRSCYGCIDFAYIFQKYIYSISRTLNFVTSY